MEPEYLPWYSPGSQLVRCLDCASLLVSGDAEVHTRWHASLNNPIGA